MSKNIKANFNKSTPYGSPAFTIRTSWATKKSKGFCLEIGSNFGELTSSLAKKRGNIVIAGDINVDIIKFAKKNSVANCKNVSLFVFDASFLPFIENCFDTVLLIDVLEHLQTPVSALKEAKRVGKRKLLIDIPNYRFAKFLYPDLLPDHFKEHSHLHRTDFELLMSWLDAINCTEKAKIHGSFIPMPLPLLGLSYFLEPFFRAFHGKPRRIHFQISCEANLG